MRDLGIHPVSRVKGKPALVRRLRALLVAVARYSRARATVDDDRRWAARVFDQLTTALHAAADPPQENRP